MIFRRIQRGQPNRVYKLVRNASSIVMTLGRGVVYHIFGDDPALRDVTWHTQAASVGLLAGIVSGKSILPGAFGLVLAYGPATSMAFYKQGGWGFMLPMPVNSIITYPITLATATTGGYLGWFSTWAYRSTYTTGMNYMRDMLRVGNNGVIVMTTAFNDTTNATFGSVNGFIRAL